MKKFVSTTCLAEDFRLLIFSFGLKEFQSLFLLSLENCLSKVTANGWRLGVVGDLYALTFSLAQM